MKNDAAQPISIVQLRELVDVWTMNALQTAEALGDQFPYYYEPVGEKWTPGGGWTDGFWTGILWRLYLYSKDARLNDLARQVTRRLAAQKSSFADHDLGFLYLNSCVLENHITGSSEMLKPALDAAARLAARFNPKGNFIRAHGALEDPHRAGYTIIDTIMNLPLLLWASQQTCNQNYYDLAVAAARGIARENVRADGGSYQVIWYDPETGTVDRKETLQGFQPDSCWTRGQAWGVYGFAMVYRLTGLQEFKDNSTRMANYFLERMPANSAVPYDFDHPTADSPPTDTSAQAIAAAGLLILAGVSTGAERQHWQMQSARLLGGLLPYVVDQPAPRGFLEGGCDFLALDRGVNADLIYGDYYLLEAILNYLSFQYQ